MHLTIRQLQVLRAVAQHLSFTQAAKELHLSQPAVSMQVKQLEAAVGLPLFEQVGKRLHLTEAGEVMVHYAHSVEAEIDAARQAIDELKGVEGGRLRISVVTTVNYFATRLLSEYCQQFPKVRVSLDVTNRQQVIQHLNDNQTDIVLMGRPPRNLDLVSTPFMENPLVVIAPTTHPLVGATQISLKHIVAEPFIIREPGSGTRMAMERFFRDHHMDPTISAEMGSNEAVKQSVEAGLGLGVVSLHTVRLELKAGLLAVLDVESFPIHRNWYIGHRAGKQLSKTFGDAGLLARQIADAVPAIRQRLSG